MKKNIKAKGALRVKTRMQHEIVEAERALHRVGVVSEGELTKTALRMLGKYASPADRSGNRSSRSC
jgi:hypothetical protein